ncbi:LptF/LptG family permease, partial [bacterium]|nr:LptF/LptG family permease [bacterium]
LSDVTMYSLDATKGDSLVSAKMPEIKIDIGTRVVDYTLPPHPAELSSRQLRTNIARSRDRIAAMAFKNPRTIQLYHRDWTEYYFKYSIPFACLALVLVAVPVSLRGPRDERNLGIILSFVLLMIYYTIFFTCRTLGSRGIILVEDFEVFGQTVFAAGTNLFPPILAGWTPSIIFIIAAAVLIAKVRK